MIKINIGDKFNKLTVLEKTNQRINRSIIYKCQCDCGNITYVKSTNLIKGYIKSCGCLQKEMANKLNKTHGLSRTKLFYIYQDMKKRCSVKNHHAYKYYGKRGIKVCDEWANNFMPFYNWATNNGYKEGLTIDRINNNGNYEPNNCRWVTMSIQCKNRRKSDVSLGKNPKARKIVKLDLSNNYICEYDCIRSALIDNNINLQNYTISACCRNKQKTAYGYKWMYKEDYELKEE